MQSGGNRHWVPMFTIRFVNALRIVLCEDAVIMVIIIRMIRTDPKQ